MATSPHLERGKSMSSASGFCRKSPEFHSEVSRPFSSRNGMPAFAPLASSRHQEEKQVCPTSAERTFKLLRSRTTRDSSSLAMAAACCAGMYSGGESPEGCDNADGIVSSKPSPWKLFVRKIKAETKKITFSKSSRPCLQYDALSYAMNFDDGVSCHLPERSHVCRPD